MTENEKCVYDSRLEKSEKKTHNDNNSFFFRENCVPVDKRMFYCVYGEKNYRKDFSKCQWNADENVFVASTQLHAGLDSLGCEMFPSREKKGWKHPREGKVEKLLLIMEKRKIFSPSKQCMLPNFVCAVCYGILWFFTSSSPLAIFFRCCLCGGMFYL